MTDKEDKNQPIIKKSDTDSDLWAFATKDVTPLSPHKATEPADKDPVTPPPQKKHVRKQSKPTEDSQIQKKEHAKQPDQIDRRTAQKLARGQIPIDERLDLHGKTQNEAYDLLLRTIPRASAQGKRCILVITGKGDKKAGSDPLNPQVGILRQKAPEWLQSDPLKQHVLKTQTARPQHGGTGALYVLLKRNR